MKRVRQIAIGLMLATASGLGLAAAVLAATGSGPATTSTNVACATASLSTPAHTVGVDSTPVDTISGTSTTRTACNTATYTIPTVTTTVSTGPTSSTSTTSTTPTTTTSTTPTTTTSTTSTSTTTTGGTIPGCNPVPTNPAPDPQTSQCQFEAYTTGYGWWDNTPPGSSTISYPVIHSVAGGTGTYANPITLAVGHSCPGTCTSSNDTPEFAPGTIWYIPNFRRYFIVEDSCGDGANPQNEACWSLAGDKADGSAPAGAQVWIDLWTDGSSVSETASNNCEDAITDNHVAILNPASNYTVVSGSIDGSSGCTAQYGDTPVTG